MATIPIIYDPNPANIQLTPAATVATNSITGDESAGELAADLAWFQQSIDSTLQGPAPNAVTSGYYDAATSSACPAGVNLNGTCIAAPAAATALPSWALWAGVGLLFLMFADSGGKKR